MKKHNYHNNFIGILSLCVPYSYSLFYALKAVLKLNNLQLFCTALFFATMLAIIMGRYVYRETFIIMVFVIAFMSLFFVTRFKYGYIDAIYSGTFLSFAVRAVPSIVLADYIARKGIIQYTIRWIEPFMYVFTLTTFVAALAERNTLMVYQEVSYYAIFAYTMNIFVIIYRNRLISENLIFFKSKIWIFVNVLLAMIQIFCMLVGGGRGAFVLFVIMSIFFVIHLFKDGKKLLVVLFCIVLITLIGCYFMQDTVNELLGFTGEGVDRLTNFFSSTNDIESDQRFRIYTESLALIKKNILLGTGIGSVFYELGNYAHNWLLDILIDTGIIGLIFVIIIIIRTTYVLIRLIRIDWKYTAILLMLIETLTNLSFSGCYLSDGRIWFCVFFSLIEYKQVRRRKHTEFLTLNEEE